MSDEAKPVAWCALTPSGQIDYFDGKPMVMPGPVGNDIHQTPLYTAAPAPVALTPLTYDQIVDALVDDTGLNLAFRSYEEDMKFARAIERAHGIKEN